MAEQLERDFSLGGAGMDWLKRVEEQIANGESKPLSEGRPRT